MQCMMREGIHVQEGICSGWFGKAVPRERRRATCVLQTVERNPTGVRPSGLSPFIQIKLIFAGFLCLRCGRWPFTAWFSTQNVTLLIVRPPSWLNCVTLNCDRPLFIAGQHSFGTEGKTWEKPQFVPDFSSLLIPREVRNKPQVFPSTP